MAWVCPVGRWRWNWNGFSEGHRSFVLSFGAQHCLTLRQCKCYAFTMIPFRNSNANRASSKWNSVCLCVCDVCAGDINVATHQREQLAWHQQILLTRCIRNGMVRVPSPPDDSIFTLPENGPSHARRTVCLRWENCEDYVSNCSEFCCCCCICFYIRHFLLTADKTVVT